MWLALAVLLYPVSVWLFLWLLLHWGRLDRLSALVSGLIVFLLLWLGLLPRDFAWPGPRALEPRLAVPLTAYLAGLAVAALLMSWTSQRKV